MLGKKFGILRFILCLVIAIIALALLFKGIVSGVITQ